MLYKLGLATTFDGNVTGDLFSSEIMIRTNVDVEDEAMLTWMRGLDAIYQPVFVDRMYLYTFTMTPIEVPGRRKKTTNDFVTHYCQKFGTHPMADGVDPAMYTVSALFVKLAVPGTSGTFELRGVLTEAELKSDNQGNPVNSNSAQDSEANERFRTFALALFNHIKTLPGGEAVMPGRKRNAEGGVNTLANYESTARRVGKFVFDGFVQRDLNKQTKSIDAKELELAKAKYSRLRTQYDNALSLADGVAGNIPPDALTEIKAFGKDLFDTSSPSNRLKLKIRAPYSAYVKENP